MHYAKHIKASFKRITNATTCSATATTTTPTLLSMHHSSANRSARFATMQENQRANTRVTMLGRFRTGQVKRM